MTSAEWTASNPVLNPGIIGVESDTGKLKIGDGRNSWTKLTYSSDAESEFVSIISGDAQKSEAVINALFPLGVMFGGTPSDL